MGAAIYCMLAPVPVAEEAARWSARLPFEGKLRSRRQPFEQPAVVGLSRVTQPIVKSVFPAVPEFDRPG
jgi:hypothetical protein